jgi:arylsulfatase A-like enzyme
VGAFRLAAAFGLLTGLVEGLAFLALQRLAFLGWSNGLVDVSLPIVWIAPAVYLPLFLGMGVVLTVLQRRLPRLRGTSAGVFLFGTLALTDWMGLLLHDRIHRAAVVLLALGVAVQAARWSARHEVGVARALTVAFPTLVTAWAAAGAVAVVAGWLEGRPRAEAAAAPGGPNVLVIVADTLRADHLSTYGYARPTSPNLDRIATRGVVFEHAFAASSWTAPSHAALLTGRHLHEHGVEWATTHRFAAIPYPTLPEVFAARGYRTAAFSANLFWFTRAMGFGRGFMHFDDYFHSPADMVLRTFYGRAFETLVLRRMGYEDIPARKRAPDVSRAFLEWVDRGGDRPFFAFLNFMDAHDPYLPPAPFRTRFATRGEPGGLLNWRLGRKDLQLTPEQREAEIDAYDGAIAYLDHHLAALVEALRARGLGDRTLVVITSDHGEAFAEHGNYLHGNSLYREEIEVPLILLGPGVPAGTRIPTPVSTAAVAATVADLADGDRGPFPGPSLALLWRAAPPDPPAVLSEVGVQPWQPPSVPVHHGAIRSLVTDRWHYIEHSRLGVEAYRWREDRDEARDLAASPQDRAEIDAVARRLKGVRLPAQEVRSSAQSFRRGSALAGVPGPRRP